jgi:molybdopterin converting factor small subunit
MLTVRYYAAARAATGVAEEVMPAATLDALRATLVDAHGDQLAKVLSVASFLVDGVAWRDPNAPLPAGSTVDVLPPFAGG